MFQTSPDARRLAVGLCLCASLAACHRVGAWDQAYACQGQEQVTTHFVALGDGADAKRDNALNMDLHVRGGRALFKTYAVPIDDPDVNRLTFNIKAPMVWLNGAFDQTTHELTLIEERLLDTPLGRQRIRTTGRFQCRAVT